MITDVQWQSLLYLNPSNFSITGRANLQWSVVRNLDLFIQRIGSRPVVLSDVRPYEAGRGRKQQHAEGTAIDTTWPGQDPLRIWQEMRGSKLFNGIGVYLNDLGAVSFHTDTRSDRTVEDPALWGDFITYPYDPVRQKNVRLDNYVGADLVLEAIKKKGASALLMAGALLFLILLKNRQKRRSRRKKRNRR